MLDKCMLNMSSLLNRDIFFFSVSFSSYWIWGLTLVFCNVVHVERTLILQHGNAATVYVLVSQPVHHRCCCIVELPRLSGRGLSLMNLSLWLFWCLSKLWPLNVRIYMCSYIFTFRVNLVYCHLMYLRPFSVPQLYTRVVRKVRGHPLYN